MGSNVRINQIRSVLRDNLDGMTVKQLSELVGIDSSNIHRIMHRMPDAYIDRWIKNGKRISAIWCVVIPPPNCPKPDKKKKAN